MRPPDFMRQLQHRTWTGGVNDPLPKPNPKGYGVLATWVKHHLGPLTPAHLQQASAPFGKEQDRQPTLERRGKPSTPKTGQASEAGA